MRKERMDVARSVARPLIELEKLIDAALLKHAEVQVALVEGRAKAKLPLHAGEAGLEQMAAAAARLIEARKATHAAHYDFRDVQDQMGLSRFKASDDRDYGDKGDTPREFMTVDGFPALSVVSEAA